jgi:hypothetical protein
VITVDKANAVAPPTGNAGRHRKKSDGDHCGLTGLAGENPTNKSPRTPEWKLQ